MGMLSVTNPTLMDFTSRSDSSGKIIANIVEMMDQTNEILHDMSFVEGNLPTGHMTSVRTGLPEAYWRMLNKGVPRGKSRSVKITDTCGMLEAYAAVDKELADLNGNTNAWRTSEDAAYIEAINQKLAETIWYGNASINAEQFTGLVYRYNDLSAESGQNVIDCGGDGADNTSIWLVVWSPNTIHGIIPKGSTAGLTMEDKGQVTLTDEDGYEYEGYKTHYQLKAGLTVRDWRYASRAANISVSALTNDPDTSAVDLIDTMDRMIDTVKSLSMGRAAFYMNKSTKSFLRRQMKRHPNVQLNTENVDGNIITDYNGIPLRICDAILNAESVVS